MSLLLHQATTINGDIPDRRELLVALYADEVAALCSLGEAFFT
jgi:hypothetical protein